MKAPGVDSGSEANASLSASLLQRLRSHDDQAWQRLMVLYGPTVLGWCRRAGLAPEDAEDVRQEVFRAVAQSLSDFRRARPGDSFRGWLWTVTRHKVIDHLRLQAGRPRAAGGSSAWQLLNEVPEASTPPDSDPHGGSAETKVLYQRALGLLRDSFSERTWRAFWGVSVDGRPAADVAAELGMSVGAVYIAKSRVLRRLRDEFADLL
jgi:RNA polymerase sigma-70 factor (ECF subfamily)